MKGAGLGALGVVAVLVAGPRGEAAAPGDRLYPPSLVRAPGTIAILILSGAQSGFPLTEVYAATRRLLERHTALRVAPLEAIGFEERDAAIRECAGDAACFVGRVRAARDEVDLLLAVSVARSGSELLVGLRLIDTRRGRQIGATGDDVPAGISLDEVLERRLADIVPDSVWDQVASLRVASDPSGAEALVDGRTCVTPCTLGRLAPGTYELLVRKSGRAPFRRRVWLDSGHLREVEVKLKKPGGGSVFESPWFWAAVGAVVVAGGVTSYVLLQEPEHESVLCFSNRVEECPSR